MGEELLLELGDPRFDRFELSASYRLALLEKEEQRRKDALRADECDAALAEFMAGAHEASHADDGERDARLAEVRDRVDRLIASVTDEAPGSGMWANGALCVIAWAMVLVFAVGAWTVCSWIAGALSLFGG